MNKRTSPAFAHGRENRVKGGVTQICAVGVGIQAHANELEGVQTKL
jgi:ribose 5-phosphate isomerase RpiB